MVTVTGYQARKNEQGKEFLALTLQSGVEIVQSQKGGLYATARKASLPCTFDEATCMSLMGTQFPGSVKKVEVEPYEYTTDSGEIITRSHRYEYIAEEENAAVGSMPGFMDVAKSSANGHFVQTL